MLFASFPFIFLFLPITITGAFLLRGRWRTFWLLIASALFYARSVSRFACVVFVLVLLLNFGGGIAVQSTTASKAKLAALFVAVNVAILLYFKYAGHLGFANAPMPLGLSFITFRMISYLLDVQQGDVRAETRLTRFGVFFGFFPQVLAGPLTRGAQLLPALNQAEKVQPKPDWPGGIFLFAVGLCKKVLLADRLGEGVSSLLANPLGMTGVTAWMALVGYGLQIYFDFSGYTDMAIGLGRLLGFELPQNFNSPYQASSPADFWRRWHMTLSDWLRDYLFYPIVLGTNFGRGTEWKYCAALLATMGLAGLWHGASWTLGLWGLYHGLLLVIYQLWKKRWNRWPAVVQRTVTFAAVTAGWSFFRASSFQQALTWLRKSMSIQAWLSSSIANLRVPLPGPFHGWDFCYLGLLAIGLWIVFTRPNASHFDRWKLLPHVQQAGLATLTFLSLLMMNYSNAFVYFQF